MGQPGDVDGILREVLRDEPVAFAYLFGSSARGQARSDSDVDVAVHFSPDVPAEQRFRRTLRIGAELERRLDREVDVVDLEDAPLRLQGRILTERRIVTGHGSETRIRFETEIFPRYVDAAYHARRLDAEVLAATAAGRR